MKTSGSVNLIIRNQDNEFMDRESVQNLVPVTGGKFIQKGEGRGKFHRAKRDIVKYEQAFEEVAYLSDEAEVFVQQFLPYAEGFAELEQQGYSVDFGILVPKGKQAGIIQKVLVRKSLFKKLSQAGVPFVLGFGANFGIKKIYAA